MSSVTTLSNPAALPAQMPPISPATGPDMRRFTGRSVAASTVAVPPEDCIIPISRVKPSSRMASSNRAT